MQHPTGVRTNSSFASARPPKLYLGAAIVATLVVIAGFAQVYYLRFLFQKPPLTLLIHVHGLIMTAWCTLFLLQAGLIATRKYELHRRVGVYGVGLAILVVILAAAVTVNAAIRTARDPDSDDIFFLGFNMAVLAQFAGFFGAGIVLRGRPEMHKRLMSLATLSLLPPAVGRIPLDFLHHDFNALIAFDLLVLTWVAADTIRFRRLNAVFAWGAPLMIVVFQGAFILAASPQWDHFWRQMLG
jgi:hypothetical protein